MFRSLLVWAKEVCFDPKHNTKNNFEYGHFIKKLLILSLIPGILTAIITIVTVSVAGSPLGILIGIGGAVYSVILFLILALLVPFVNGAVVHFFGKIIFKLIKKDYKKTYNASAYGMVPSFLFGWIPFVGSIIGAIWSIIVQTYAISNQHGVKPKTALIVVLIPIIIILAIAFAVIGTAILTLGPLLGGSMMSGFPY